MINIINDSRTIHVDIQHSLQEAAEILKNADAVLITAGAGMGVDSGLPDFRGNEGFWKAYPPIAAMGISFSEMANPEWFVVNSALAWGFYGHRLNLYRRIIPHYGFTQLLEIVSAKPGGYFVFTSNVDGQFQKAGFASDKIVEHHGSIHHFQCITPCTNHIWDASACTVDVDEELLQASKPLPVCPNCGEIARPNILMFGDWSWIYNRSHEQTMLLNKWLVSVSKKEYKLAIIEFGAGKFVPNVRLKSQSVARRYQADLVRVNPRDYQVPDTKYISLPLGAEQAINSLYEQMGYED